MRLQQTLFSYTYTFWGYVVMYESAPPLSDLDLFLLK